MSREPRKGEVWLILRPGLSQMPQPDSPTARGVARIVGRARSRPDGTRQLMGVRLDGGEQYRGRRGAIPIDWLVARLPWPDEDSD